LILPTGLKKLIVKIDEEKIKEVITNILDNAIQYTPTGGIIIKIIDEEKLFTIKIIDTGIGIKKDDLSDLFNKFVRLENAKNIRPDGTGIGLYFCKLIIDAHEGKIFVESPGEGKGSAFTIRLKKR
jgi:signal transduction histidine kinase